MFTKAFRIRENRDCEAWLYVLKNELTTIAGSPIQGIYIAQLIVVQITDMSGLQDCLAKNRRYPRCRLSWILLGTELCTTLHFLFYVRLLFNFEIYITWISNTELSSSKRSHSTEWTPPFAFLELCHSREQAFMWVQVVGPYIYFTCWRSAKRFLSHIQCIHTFIHIQYSNIITPEHSSH